MIRALVFDLCDTVVRTAGARALLSLPGLEGCQVGQLEEWFERDPLFIAYECGRVDSAVFLRHFRQYWRIEADLEVLQAAYEDLVVAEIEGMGALVAEAQASFALLALSNNNPLLWQGICRVCPWLDRFEEIFLSHQIGALKPDPAAFDHVLAHGGYRADEVVLIDDNPVCVAAARQMGWHGIQFVSALGTRRALRDLLGGQISA